MKTTIADLMSEQHSDPLRVVMFSTDTDRAEDLSHPIAQEILRRLGLEGAACRQRWRTSSISRRQGSSADAAAGQLVAAA